MPRQATVTTIMDAANFRAHEHSCFNCRYYRVHETGAAVSECLALGQTIGIVSAKNILMLADWAKQRICDVWARRPPSWNIYSKGVDNSPYWKDPYLPRDLNQRRKKLILSRGRNASA